VGWCCLGEGLWLWLWLIGLGRVEVSLSSGLDGMASGGASGMMPTEMTLLLSTIGRQVTPRLNKVTQTALCYEMLF